MVGWVAVPAGWQPRVRIGDSKQLTPQARERAYEGLMHDTRILCGIRSVDSVEIDQKGVYRALREIHLGAHQDGLLELRRMYESWEAVRILSVADGNLDLGPGIVSLPKADALVPAVSAASILAKATRDHEMVRLGQVYPGYGLETHKGYGTQAHQDALRELGVSVIHRRSYAPIQRLLDLAVVVQKGWEES